MFVNFLLDYELYVRKFYLKFVKSLFIIIHYFIRKV